MSPLAKIVVLLAFIVAEAIFEAWLNEKIGVKIHATSSWARILNRVVVLATGGIIVLIQIK